MNKSYKVVFFQDNEYQIFQWDYDIIDFDSSPSVIGGFNYQNPVFQGTLPECEAWIRLKEGGYL